MLAAVGRQYLRKCLVIFFGLGYSTRYCFSQDKYPPPLERILFRLSSGIKISGFDRPSLEGWIRCTEKPSFSLNFQLNMNHANPEISVITDQDLPKMLTASGSIQFCLSRTLNVFGGGCQAIFASPTQYAGFVGGNCCIHSTFLQYGIGGLQWTRKQNNLKTEDTHQNELVILSSAQIRVTQYSLFGRKYRGKQPVYCPRAGYLQMIISKECIPQSFEMGIAWCWMRILQRLHAKFTLAYDFIEGYQGWQQKTSWLSPFQVQITGLTPYDPICIGKPLRLTKHACLPLMVPQLYYRFSGDPPGRIRVTAADPGTKENVSHVSAAAPETVDTSQVVLSDLQTTCAWIRPTQTIVPNEITARSLGDVSENPDCHEVSDSDQESRLSVHVPFFCALVARLEDCRERRKRPVLEKNSLLPCIERSFRGQNQAEREQWCGQLRVGDKIAYNCRDFFFDYSHHLCSLILQRPLRSLEERRWIHHYRGLSAEKAGIIWFPEMMTDWDAFFPCHPMTCMLRAVQWWDAPVPEKINSERLGIIRILRGLYMALERERQLYDWNYPTIPKYFEDFKRLFCFYHPDVPTHLFEKQLQRIHVASHRIFLHHQRGLGCLSRSQGADRVEELPHEAQ